MLQGVVLKTWHKQTLPSMQATGPLFRRYKGPLAKFILGTSSLIVFSTGSILCDSERPPSTPTPSPSSRNHTVEDALDAKQRQKQTETEQSAAEKGALDRIKSSFQDIQAKLSGLEPPSLSPVTFGLPPNLREWVDKIRAEVDFAPGSVSDEIWTEARDPRRNPEIEKDARVWTGNQISAEELAFYEKRREFTRKALARYLGVNEKEVDARDVPNIAVAGSGGGYRAMIGTTGYFKAMKACGLFDCVTYMAGVSGSCWAINTYMTYGERSIPHMIDHFKARLGKSFTDPYATFPLMMERPTNKYLLRGLVERFKEGYTELGMVDIYGTLVSSRILVPANELDIRDDWLKLSNQRRYCDDGTEPLPIYTAVRHEIPRQVKKEEKKEENGEVKDLGSTGDDKTVVAEAELQQKAREESWFQWFEITPYYLGCEELEAWIPTWGVGRQYNNGTNITRTPELRLPILIGIVGSAFCATLSHYYAEIRPYLPTSYSLFRSLDDLMTQKDADLIVIHPIEPASIPNFLHGMHKSLPATCPESIKTDPEIQLMDGGMSNNIPFYPLLRRDVDIIIALDTSADIQTTPWFERTDGYAKQRGIIGWPIGVGWPKDSSAKELGRLETAEATTPEEAQTKLSQAKAEPKPDEPSDPTTSKYGLGHVNIWIGTTAQRTSFEEPPPSKQMPLTVDESWQLDTSDDGVMLIYCPFLPNAKVPGLDPETTEFLSTWNFEYKPEEVDSTVALAEANFKEGQERIRRAVRAVWLRKREARLAREKEEGRLLRISDRQKMFRKW